MKTTAVEKNSLTSNEDIISALFDLQDSGYKSFHSRLMPTVDPNTVIGVRTPKLRKLARELWQSGNYDTFMSSLPHSYYEENNLHAFLIERITDFDECITELERFLPYVDNWATCDMMSPKIFLTNTDRLYENICSWIRSNDVYTVRFAIKTLISLYATDKFDVSHTELVLSVNLDDYYVKMAVAWYIATVLAYHYDDVIVYLKNGTVDTWIRKKAIQKAIESYRISNEKKLELKALNKEI